MEQYWIQRSDWQPGKTKRSKRDWIKYGMPLGGEEEPKLVSIEVEPARGTLQPHARQQLTSLAHYSDGAVRNITSLALYECNDDAMAAVTEAGLVTASDIPGKVAVMVRYQGQVAVYSGSVPLGARVEELPPAKNFIDELAVVVRDHGPILVIVSFQNGRAAVYRQRFGHQELLPTKGLECTVATCAPFARMFQRATNGSVPNRGGLSIRLAALPP